MFSRLCNSSCDLCNPRQLRFHNFLQDSLFIVIEYVEGGSLADMRKRYGPWPERLVAKYTAQLLEGLDFLHQQVRLHFSHQKNMVI